MAKRLLLKRARMIALGDGRLYHQYVAEDGSMNNAVLMDDFTDTAEWAVVFSGSGIVSERFQSVEELLTDSRTIVGIAEYFAETMRARMRDRNTAHSASVRDRIRRTVDHAESLRARARSPINHRHTQGRSFG